MSQFQTDFAEAGLADLLEYSGEDVIYTPPPSLTPGVAPVPRTIRARVKRGPIQTRTETGKTQVGRMEITVANDADSGIAAADQPWLGGTITVAYVPGLAAAAFPIHRHPADAESVTPAKLMLVLL
jgi:hypothetical protein